MDISRIIKFRVCNKATKSWVHGPGHEINLFGEVILLGGFMQGIPLRELNDCVAFQFTGLLDKNSKEIYEGDIVECGWVTRQVGIVAYHFGRYLVVSPEEYLDDTLSRPNSGNCWYISELSNMITSSPEEIFEIIGNVFENSELLTK